MKKILLALLLIISFGVSEYHASEIEMSKQEMMRETEVPAGAVDSPVPPEEDSPVVDMEQTTASNTNWLAIIGVSAVIVTVVGVSSIFITKFALSLRGNEEDIYKRKNDEENQDD